MYIELLCEVNTDFKLLPYSAELVGVVIDESADYMAVVRTREGFMLKLLHPSKITLLEEPAETDTIAQNMVTLLARAGMNVSTHRRLL